MHKSQQERYQAAISNAVRKTTTHNKAASKHKRLYAVTTIAASDEFNGIRTPVICTSFERANEIVENNEGDIQETVYNLIVVEAIIPDVLYSSPMLGEEKYWYVWNNDDMRYYPIEEPENCANMYGFGVG